MQYSNPTGSGGTTAHTLPGIVGSARTGDPSRIARGPVPVAEALEAAHDQASCTVI